MREDRPHFFISLFNNWTYVQKFLVISFLYAISIAVAASFMVQAQNKQIQFSKDEIAGNNYQRFVRRIFENIPRHRDLTDRYLKGDKSVKIELASLQAQVSKDFHNLAAHDKDVENILHTNAHEFQEKEWPILKPTEIMHRWEDLNRQLSDLTPAESERRHIRILDDLQRLIQYVGESSNVALESDPATFYLINPLFKLTPEMQLIITQLTCLGEKIIEEQTPDLTPKVRLIEMMALASHNIAETKSDLEMAFVINKSINNELVSEAKLKDLIKQYTEAAQDYLEFINKNILIPPKPLQENKDELLKLQNKLLDKNIALADTVSDIFEAALQERIYGLRVEQFTRLVIVILTAVLAFIFGLYFMREISRPLSNLVRAANHIAAGDLSTRVSILYKDEIGQLSQAFNQMAESFQELIGQLQWAGIQLTTSTTEIAAAAKQQESTVVQQEATTKQIAVTAREISTTAKDFAKTMNEVSNTAEQTSSLAAAGKAGLNQMETVMRQMVDASSNIASKLAVLNDKAGTITSVITTISKVADQTNLLSLNAAIEAEKAGEHGRSFAVIAREIRRLADQTANATLDIEKMVNEMVSAVSAGVMGVDKFSEEIHRGVNQISTVSGQLSKIIEQVQQQTTSFENVNQGMQVQSLGAEQINESIIQLSEAAQQTTESIRQFHKAIEQLNNAAQEMQAAVIKLKR